MADLDERDRHRREVQYVLLLRTARGRTIAFDYLDRVQTARGDEVRQRLEKDATDQWAMGNRGTTWIDRPVD